MKRVESKLLFLLVLAFGPFFSRAGGDKDLHFPALTIADSLKENSDAVVREDIQTFEIEDMNHAKLTI